MEAIADGERCSRITSGRNLWRALCDPLQRSSPGLDSPGPAHDLRLSPLYLALVSLRRPELPWLYALSVACAFGHEHATTGVADTHV